MWPPHAVLLKNVLPALAFRIFLMLVPVLLFYIGRHISRLPAKSTIDFEVGRRFYIFQVVIVYLFTTVVGAMLAQLPAGERARSVFPLIDLVKALADDPQQVRNWLARSIPQQVWSFAALR